MVQIFDIVDSWSIYEQQTALVNVLELLNRIGLVVVTDSVDDQPEITWSNGIDVREE